MGIHRIIALDLGKFKTVACVMNAADRGHVFETIEMSPRAVQELLARHATADPHDTRVVFETCDCAGWVHDVCVALGLPAVVASANAEAWRWQRVKRTTGAAWEEAPMRTHPHRRPLSLDRAGRPGTVPPRPQRCVSPVRHTTATRRQAQ